MRRLASVFAASPRRADNPDAPPTSSPPLVHKRSRVFLSLSRKHLVTDPPIAASDLVNSSSSSSSGSTTIRTPDDDGLPRTPSKKGSWKSWLGGKNAVASDNLEEHRPTPWQSSQNVPHPPKPGANETDDASLHSDDPYVIPDGTLPTSYPQQLAAARVTTRTMIMNSLVHDPTAPPLYHSSDAFSFPRSCYNSQRLRRRETLESEMHKKMLLVRLDRLSFSEKSSIIQLASKSIRPKPQAHRNFQGDFFPSADSMCLHSRGLESWVSRPCFEDRLQLWTRLDSGEIIRTRIPGSHLGVAALEFSESLELLAGMLPESDEEVEIDNAFDPPSEFTLPPLTWNLDPPATQVKEFELEPLSAPSPPSQPKDSCDEQSPPPQPTVAPPASLPNTPSSARRRSEPTTSGSAAANDATPKRGVRFAEDDGKDDQIPLGYVLRIRKNKEQKARFLREERERRERVAQLPVENRRAAAPPQENRAPRVVAPRRPPPRPLISLKAPPKPPQAPPISHAVREEDRIRREIEKTEMEKLRRSRDLAKKQAEERERTFAEELQATRARREASRAGRPLDSMPVSSRDRSLSRDSMHLTLQRSSMSHKHTPDLVFTPVSPYDGSPSSSVPATPRSQYSLSRPPSIYSSHTASSEDIRGRDSRHVSKRMSVVSDSAKGVSLHPPYDPRASFNPYAWNVPLVAAVPPVPPIPAMPMVNGLPFYGMDVPLLPPTPPFMMNQFGPRSRSYAALAGQQSPLQSSTSLPRNDSSEGINSSSRTSSPHSSGSHHRHSSDDAIRREKTLGDTRPGSYSELHGTKQSVTARGIPSRSGPQRSSWLPPEQAPTKKSSTLRPVSGSYTYARRRTAAS